MHVASCSFALVILLSPFLSAQPDSTPASTADALRLDGEEVVLRLTDGAKLSFEDLLRFTHDRTGHSFVFDEALLFGRMVPFVGEHRVPAKDMLPFTRLLLAESGFRCFELPGTNGGILRILDQESVRHGTAYSLSSFVSSDALLSRPDDWRRQSGRVITTSVPLMNQRARSLYATLRPGFTGYCQEIAPADDANAMVVTGDASTVVEMTLLIQELDRQGRQEFQRIATGEMPSETAAAMLKSYFEQCQPEEEGSKAGNRSMDSKKAVSVVAVPGQNAVIVYAGPADLGRAAELLENVK